MVQRVGGGDGADEDEHDQAHSFLPIVGAVEEADARAGEDEQAANPERRRFGALRGFVEFLVLDDGFEREEEGGGKSEAEDRGEQERLADLESLSPVNAAGPAARVHELVSDANTDDRADERVRAGSREAEPPGAEVPEDGGGQQGEDHSEASAGANLQDQFNREEGDDAESDGAGGGDHSSEIPEAGPDDGNLRLHRVGVDDGGDGVGGVVESVDELKGQGDQERGAEENVRPGREDANAGEVVGDA